MAWLPRVSFPGASAVPPASRSRQITYSSRIAARYWRSLVWYRESPLMALFTPNGHFAVTGSLTPKLPLTLVKRGPEGDIAVNQISFFRMPCNGQSTDEAS